MTSGNAMATGLAFAVFAVGTHGHAEFLEEKALEVFVAAEAATFRDVFDRQFRACEQSRHAFQLMPSDAIVDRFALKLAEPEVGLQKAQGPGVCKLPKPPASRALCQAKRAPRAAFPSGCS